MKVADQYLAVALTVMDNDDMPFLFGLDMLRRHQVPPPCHAACTCDAGPALCDFH